MRRTYAVDNGILRERELAADLICYSNPDQGERVELMAMGISDHDVSCALDPDELGRVDYWDGQAVIIVKSPRNYSERDSYLFKVTSFGIFYFPEKIVMISPFDERELLEQRSLSKLRTRNDVCLKLIAATVSHFFGHLRVISLISDELEHKVDSSLENQHLLSMFAIGKSLVFMLNGISSNTAVLERLKHLTVKLGFGEEEMELLDDIIIENAQCNRQAQIYAEILTSLTEARGNIVNNNLSILMKRLTIVSVVFAPVNLIAGIGGMSEYSAMTRHLPLWLSYPLMLTCMLAISSLTYLALRKMGLQSKPKKRVKARGK